MYRWSLLILLVSITTLFAGDESDWLTYYEKSGYLETPRYPETIEYCKRLDAASDWLKYTSFGTSPQGRELPLVIVDKNGHFTPSAVQKSGNAILLIQSGIHAGEIDGKDASLMLMREMVISKKLSHLLNGVTILFIPIFNVDGHERFGPYNRINQNGPKEMGWRTTAQNFNLNRDFMKADAPEMQAWLRLFNRWLPDLMVDCHVTDGADYQYPVTYAVATDRRVAEPLKNWTTEVFEPEINRKLSAEGIPIFPYIWLRKRPDIKDGLVGMIGSPRFSTGYGAVQNRIFYLIETHMLKDYRTRVDATYQLLKNIIDLAGEKRNELKQVNRLSDEQTANKLPGRFFPLRFRVDYKDSTMVDFLGIDYKIVDSEVSGGKWVQFGEKPIKLRIPFFGKNIITDSAKVPYAWLIPAQWQTQVERLKLHGVQISYLEKEVILEVESYRFSNVHWQNSSFEGHHFVNFDMETVREKRSYPPGTAVIVMNQRTNRVITHLLEPGAPDSFVRWGFWNTIFERKEYAEDYVLEKIAREMLAANPELKEEFQQAVAADTSFAKNHWARLYFFYQRTPYWDQNMNRYPVGKLMEKTTLPLKATK